MQPRERTSFPPATSGEPAGKGGAVSGGKKLVEDLRFAGFLPSRTACISPVLLSVPSLPSSSNCRSQLPEGPGLMPRRTQDSELGLGIFLFRQSRALTRPPPLWLGCGWARSPGPVALTLEPHHCSIPQLTCQTVFVAPQPPLGGAKLSTPGLSLPSASTLVAHTCPRPLAQWPASVHRGAGGGGH